MATKKYLSYDGLVEYDGLIKAEIATKADADHLHTIDSIDGLQEAVNAAADSKFYVVTFDKVDGVYHADLTFAEIREKFEAGGNMVARIDGTDYIPLLSASATQIIFSGIYKSQSVSLTVDSDETCTLFTTQMSERNHTHVAASTTSNGFMSSTDKTKLNSIEDGAEVNVIESISVNGEEVPVTDKAVNITIPEQSKADWNQNEETAADYIKNRPFYDNSEILLDTVTVNNGDTLNFSVDSLGNQGDTVTVVWDDAYIDQNIGYFGVINGMWDVQYYTLGNQSKVPADEITDEGNYTGDTGEDYVIYNYPKSSTSTIICDSNPHTLTIIKGQLVKIDEKFIPDTIARKSYVDQKIDEIVIDNSSPSVCEAKMPIELGAFQYFKWENLSGTIEEKAQQLARYGVIVYQGELSGNLALSGTEYQNQLALYTKALEYNPNLKVFGYVTARGFAYQTGDIRVGMTEYRTSPANVDHPIWTKEELAAYINIMAHCGGTRDTSTTDEFGNPTLTGGIPLYGVFFDDYDYNFEDDNTHLMNQGDWASIREKHNFLIDYCHSRGLRVMANSNPSLIFDNTATPDTVRNPDGIVSHMGEEDWFCAESYFLRSDNTFGLNDKYVSDYNDNYRAAYGSKCLALTYVHAVTDDNPDNEAIASTYAIYQALCQGVDSIALHGATLFTEIPEEFAKYYDKNGNAVRTHGTDYYKLQVNGHEIIAHRSDIDTAYGRVPNYSALSTLSVTVNGRTFNNMYPRTEEIGQEFATLKSEVTNELAELSAKVEQSSNLYHRAFIDDWEKNYTLADYTNHCFTFQNAFGGEDTGATSNWISLFPYDFTVELPQQWSWRRVTMDARHLAGKTVELGFEHSDAYVSGYTSTKVGTAVWQVVGVCESNSNLTITTFNARSTQTSVIDGVSRCCVKFTMPSDIQELMFWMQRTDASPTGTWVIEANGSYLVDVSEHTTKKTWFTNYAPPMSNWGIMGSWSNYEVYRDGEQVSTVYTAKTDCYESGLTFPANSSIFKPGETWEIGFKDIKMTYDDGQGDVSSKITIMFNIGTSICPDLYIYGKTYSDYKSMKSATGDDSLIAITRFTIPSTYSGGMPSTPMYIWPTNYVGGDNWGMYKLTVEGLYMYKIDEKDELAIRGEEPSDTYVMINRITTDRVDEELEPDSLYIVDDGSVFATDFRGNRVPTTPQKQIILLSSTEGSTKQFRITVDDTGALTASEVVT